MTSLPAADTLGTVLLALLGTGLLAVMLRPVYMPLWRLFRGTQQFLEDWFGEPARPGQKERPGAMARLAQLERNSGASLRDVVDRIEGRLEEVAGAAEQATTAAGLAVNEAKVGRAITAEASERNRTHIAELRTAVAGLVNALDVDETERRKKEAAYVAALNRLGVPLTPIVEALEESPDHQP